MANELKIEAGRTRISFYIVVLKSETVLVVFENIGTLSFYHTFALSKTIVKKSKNNFLSLK